MIEKLIKINDDQIYAEFYSDEVDSFDFGKISFLNEEFIIIHMFTPEGLDDGYFLEKTKNIVKVKTKSEYIETMIKLIEYNNQEKSHVIFDEDPVISLMSFAKSKGEIISVELLDSGITDVIGFIKEIDADFCKLGCVDFYGNDEGTVYIRTDKITKISLWVRGRKNSKNFMGL